MTKVLFGRVPDDLYEVVDTLSKAERRSQNMMTQILLEEALTARNLWDSSENTPPVKNVKPETPKKIASEPSGSGASIREELGTHEFDCCLNEITPCKHWTWDVNLAIWKNILSGRTMEAES